MARITAKSYEASRPANEQKLVLANHVIRAYTDDDGTLHVLAHRRDFGGFEELPSAYFLGTNALKLEPRLK